MRLRSALTALVLAATVGCTSSSDEDGTMDVRSDQVADCVTDIHMACGQHMADIFLAAQELDQVASFETEHYTRTREVINDFFYWLDSLHDCTNNDGNAPDTMELNRIGVDAYVALLMHRIRMNDAETLGQARSIERAYQDDMTRIINAARAAHDTFDLTLADYSCPDNWPHPDFLGDLPAAAAPNHDFHGHGDVASRPTRGEFLGDKPQSWKPKFVLWPWYHERR
jgi:hypothetical protein